MATSSSPDEPWSTTAQEGLIKSLFMSERSQWFSSICVGLADQLLVKSFGLEAPTKTLGGNLN